MNICWKCGDQVLGGGSECYACAEGGPRPLHTDEELERIDDDFRKNFMEVDWSKVTTLQEVIAILSTHGEPIFVDKDSPDFERLKKYLKPIDQ
jgi:hypothetical protein